MYKLAVDSGLGDCLRVINNTKIVARCLAENTKCFLNYKVKNNEQWSLDNKETFKKFVEAVSIFEYVDDDAFLQLDVPKANDKRHFSEPLVPIPLHGTLPINIDSSATNVAVHVAGSCFRKTFTEEQLSEIFHYFRNKNIVFHIVDKPSKVSANRKAFKKFSNVVCSELTFNQNYQLITMCDMLLAPDSFSKYVARTAKIKMILVCCMLPYISDITLMFKYCFADIADSPDTTILGWKTESTLVGKIADFPAGEIIKALELYSAKCNDGYSTILNL